MFDMVITFGLLMLSSLITPSCVMTLCKVIKDNPHSFLSTILFLAFHIVGFFVIIGFGAINAIVGLSMSITAFTICSFFSLFFSCLFYCNGADGFSGHSNGVKHFLRASVILNMFIVFIAVNLVI